MKGTFTQTIAAGALFVLLVTCGLSTSANCTESTKSKGHPFSLASVIEGFHNPPDSTKPGVYWYWLNDNISQEGVTRDLEAMASVGIGRAYIGNIGLDDVPYGKVKLFSDEWWNILHTALRTAAKLGIDIGIFNSPGWSQSGGPWVTPDKTMRYMATKEFHAKGPGKLRIDLNVPYEHFQQVAVLAFPEPRNDEVEFMGANSKITANIPLKDVRNMFDGNHHTETNLPSGMPGVKPVEIDIEMDKPFTARSITLYPVHKPFRIDCELQVYEKGSFQQVRKFELDRSISWLSLGFLPYGPVCISFPAVKSTKFRLVFTNMRSNPFMGIDSAVGGFTEIVLSAVPRVERYVEKQLGKMVQDVAPAWDAYKWSVQSEPNNQDQCVDRSRIINITHSLSSDGFLNWDVPEGSWTLLRAGMVPTGITNAPATPEGRGLEIDKMSKEGIRMHFNAFIKRMLDRIPANDRKTFKYVIADSYETGSENWTDGCEDLFRKQYGYDPLPWLPVLAGRIVGTADQSNRFLWDLRRLVADLVAYNYVGELRKISNEHGLALWLENYGTWGFPSEFLKYGGQSDELSGEFWADGLFGIGPLELRAASSAAHIYGKQKVWSESWTSGDKPFWRYPALLKKLGDWAFAQGVNSTLLHVAISQPYEDRHPGMNAAFGTEFNRFNTWFGKSRVFIDYIRRCNFMLQQGRPVVDAAYLIGEDAPVMTGIIEPELPRGYSFDYINADVIENRLSVKDGKLVLTDGLSYSILILPPQETMRPHLLRKIRDLVRGGAVVVGPRPLRSPSLQNYPAADDEVKELAKQLWGDLDGRTSRFRKCGKGMIMTGVDMQTAFKMINEAPDFHLSGQDSILYIHRRLTDADIYFVSNQTDRMVTITPTFRVHGMQPQFWDAVSGRTRILPIFTGRETGTSVPLTLGEGQSGFIVFVKQGMQSLSDSSARNFPITSRVCEIDGRWEVTFDPQMRGPVRPVVFDTLEDWTRHVNNDIRYYSGSAVYRTKFTLDTLPRAEHIVLDLGKFSAIADVRINGVHAGGIWTNPPQLEVAKNLKIGENQLEIEVTNTWVNRIIGDLKVTPAERKTWMIVNPYTTESLLQPSGLLGPVRLLALDYRD